jgi:outer membrane immunogenic protein
VVFVRKGFIASISLAAICFVSICTMAHAADVSSAYPVKAKTPPALAPDWTGFYIGPTVGWTFASSKGDYTGVTVNPPPLMVYYPFDLKPSGAAIGGLFGYNFRYARWLYGIEGDLSWIANANDQAYDPAGSGRYDKIDLFWTAHARGRIGYLFDQYLIYFAGGAAFAGTRNWHYALDTLYDSTRTRVGFSLGGGIEAALNEQWRVRAEYLYDRFNNQYFGWTSTRYSNSDLTLNTIRLAIVYCP